MKLEIAGNVQQKLLIVLAQSHNIIMTKVLSILAVLKTVAHARLCVMSVQLQYKSHIGSVGVEQTKNVPEKLELASHFIRYK